METLMQIEINEIAEIFVSFKKYRIGVSEILKFLKYKDPIFYKDLTGSRLKNEIVKLFPLYKNKRKNTRCFKISKSQTKKNRDESNLRIKPFKEIKIQLYGINETYFKKI